MDVGVGRRFSSALLRLVLTAGVIAAGIACLAPAAFADTSIKVQGREWVKNGPDPVLDTFTWIVTVDNAKDPFAADPLKRPGFGGTESNAPTVATGDETDNSTGGLPAGRYLVTVRSPDHKMWGRHIEIAANGTVYDNDGDGQDPTAARPVLGTKTVRVSLRPTPIPAGHIKVQVFHDNAWVNNAPDDAELGLAGFHVLVYDEFHQHVTVDGDGDKICGGTCITDSDGAVDIPNMHPGLYFIEAIPPKGSGWIQDSTFDGGFYVAFGVEEGSDGSGVPAESLWLPPNKQTITTFGFVKKMNFQSSGSATIKGTVKNEVSWAPNEVVTLGETVPEPYIALSSNTTDEQVYTAQGNKDGTFTISNVPAGSYTMSIWDEDLDYIIRFINVDVTAGQTIDLNQLDGNGDGLADGGIGIPRWFGWLEGNVYNDLNNNGTRDPGEPAVPNTDVDERWRDGSIKEATMTDKNGHYNYTEAEGGPLGKWFIGEVGFGRFATTGATAHPDRAFETASPPPATVFGTDGPGGGLLTAEMINVGHHHDVDWGKRVYAEGEPGQIVGVVYHGTTRNEVDAYKQGHEDYEPGIPDVTVLLKTKDGQVINDYSTDHYQAPTDCEVRNNKGDLMNPLDPGLPFNPLIPKNCIESPLLSNQTKDAGFDGGYAFADMCPLDNVGHSTYPCDEDQKVPLTPGKYITQVLMPNDANGDAIYQITREEDVNVDNGVEFTPQIPPFPCVGPDHVVSGAPARAKTNGKHRRLCDERLVTLKQKQNANVDFYLFTANDIQVPGRVIGLVTNDVAIDNDPQSLWWLNKRPESVPIGIYDRDPAVGGRLIKTISSDEMGQYEVELPSTETINCPTPAGVCPGMYWFQVNDPGTKQHPNKNFNPNFITEGVAWSVWPGLTAQLDTPVIGIAQNGGCDIPAATPQLMEVSKPLVEPADTGTNRRITIRGMGFGATRGSGGVTLAGTNVATSNIISWSDTEIVIQVPTVGSGGGQISGGQKQLLIRADNGQVSPSGITLHVLGGSYNPHVVHVPAPSSDAHALQDAISASTTTPGSLVVLAKGQYQENVIIGKRLMLQGSGPGGVITAEAGGGADVPVSGTSINGRFFPQYAQAWRNTLNALSFGGNQNVQEGAGITVVATSSNSSSARFNTGTPARIDGIGLITSQGLGGGGLQVNAYARNLQITNNVIEGNEGGHAGGIGLGTPYVGNNENDNIVIRYNQVQGNGARTKAGGIGIFNGADGYEVSDNIICSNFSFEYGGGVSHYGRSPAGKILRNKVVWNEAANSQGGSGGALSLSGEIPNGGGLGSGSGSLTVERNLIEGNYAGDDGGAMFIQQVLTDQADIRNNMVVNNASGDTGGAILTDDSSNVRIVNNTLAENATTGTTEARDGQPHAAGVAVEENEPAFNPSGSITLAPGGHRYTPPRALFNNIFNENHAYTYDGPLTSGGSPATAPALTDNGFMDFEVVGWPTRSLDPRRSILSTNVHVANPGGGNPGFNQVGADPLFAAPWPLDFNITGQVTNPQFVSVTIVRPNAPQDIPGDYHINAGSPAIGAAVTNLGGVNAPSDDYDGQNRTGSRDIGADER